MAQKITDAAYCCLESHSPSRQQCPRIAGWIQTKGVPTDMPNLLAQYHSESSLNQTTLNLFGKLDCYTPTALGCGTHTKSLGPLSETSPVVVVVAAVVEPVEAAQKFLVVVAT
jgi:hypothetical protein